jgi:hypothetical protein
MQIEVSPQELALAYPHRSGDNQDSDSDSKNIIYHNAEPHRKTDTDRKIDFEAFCTLVAQKKLEKRNGQITNTKAVKSLGVTRHGGNDEQHAHAHAHTGKHHENDARNPQNLGADLSQEDGHRRVGKSLSFTDNKNTMRASMQAHADASDAHTSTPRRGDTSRALHESVHKLFTQCLKIDRPHELRVVMETEKPLHVSNRSLVNYACFRGVMEENAQITSPTKKPVGGKSDQNDSKVDQSRDRRYLSKEVSMESLDLNRSLNGKNDASMSVSMSGKSDLRSDAARARDFGRSQSSQTNNNNNGNEESDQMDSTGMATPAWDIPAPLMPAWLTDIHDAHNNDHSNNNKGGAGIRRLLSTVSATSNSLPAGILRGKNISKDMFGAIFDQSTRGANNREWSKGYDLMIWDHYTGMNNSTNAHAESGQNAEHVTTMDTIKPHTAGFKSSASGKKYEDRDRQTEIKGMSEYGWGRLLQDMHVVALPHHIENTTQFLHAKSLSSRQQVHKIKDHVTRGGNAGVAGVAGGDDRRGGVDGTQILECKSPHPAGKKNEAGRGGGGVHSLGVEPVTDDDADINSKRQRNRDCNNNSAQYKDVPPPEFVLSPDDVHNMFQTCVRKQELLVTVHNAHVGQTVCISQKHRDRAKFQTFRGVQGVLTRLSATEGWYAHFQGSGTGEMIFRTGPPMAANQGTARRAASVSSVSNFGRIKSSYSASTVDAPDTYELAFHRFEDDNDYPAGIPVPAWVQVMPMHVWKQSVAFLCAVLAHKTGANPFIVQERVSTCLDTEITRLCKHPIVAEVCAPPTQRLLDVYSWRTRLVFLHYSDALRSDSDVVNLSAHAIQIRQLMQMARNFGIVPERVSVTQFTRCFMESRLSLEGSPQASSLTYSEFVEFLCRVAICMYPVPALSTLSKKFEGIQIDQNALAVLSRPAVLNYFGLVLAPPPNRVTVSGYLRPGGHSAHESAMHGNTFTARSRGNKTAGKNEILARDGGMAVVAGNSGFGGNMSAGLDEEDVLYRCWQPPPGTATAFPPKVCAACNVCATVCVCW